MKNYFLFMFTFCFLLIGILGCVEESKKKVITTVILLNESDNNIIMANNSDMIVLNSIVKDQFGEGMSNKNVEYFYINEKNIEVKLEKSVFKIDKSGKYKLYCEIENIKSENGILIIANELPKANAITIINESEKNNILADNEDSIELSSIIFDQYGNKMESNDIVYFYESNEEKILLDNNKFYINESGLYIVKAKLNNLISENEIIINAKDISKPKMIIVINKSERNNILSNDTDTIELSSLVYDQNGENINNLNVKYFYESKGLLVELESNVFKSKEIGNYKIKAKLNELISNNELIINVKNEEIEEELTPIEKTKKWLTFDIIKKENTSKMEIKSDLNLIKTGIENTKIEWIVFGSDRINSDTGEVLQVNTNNELSLVAKLTHEDEYDEKVFILKIIKLSISDFSLNKTEIVFTKKSETFKLETTILPEKIVDKSVSYVTNNDNVIAIDSNGLITVIGNGETIITVTSNYDKSLSKQCQVKVEMEVEKEEEKENEEEIIYTTDFKGIRATFPLGGNLGGNTDYSRANIFVDLMNSAKVIGTPTAPWTPLTNIDSSGWPNEDFGVVLLREQIDVNNKGIYKLIFKCSTIPKINAVASKARVENLKRDDNTGIVTGDLILDTNQKHLMLSFTDTNGGVKNLKVIRPNHDENELFTRYFLEHMNRFQTVRFMDWPLTNNSKVSTWDSRAKPSDAVQAEKGVAWEYAIELCNVLKADMWICIPHMADDDYVERLAELIKEKLNPELNIYVEWSNEVWNAMFTQTHWTHEQANKSPMKEILDFDGNTNEYYTGWRYVGYKIKWCSEIFAEVWGKEEINQRVRPVLAYQIGRPRTYREALKFLAGYYEGVKYKSGALFEDSNQTTNVNDYLYAVAGAPYYNLGDLQFSENLSTTDVINALKKDVDSKNYGVLKEIADDYKLKMLAYEGGTDTFGDGSLEAKYDAQNDPRHKDIIQKYLTNWYDAGGELFTWYVADATIWTTQYGTWGLADNPYTISNAKIDAIDYIIENYEYTENNNENNEDENTNNENNNNNSDVNIDIDSPLIGIDFDNFEDVGPNIKTSERIDDKNFVFSSANGLKVFGDIPWSKSYPSNILHLGAWGDILTIKKSDNTPFAIKSIKLFRPQNINDAKSAIIKGVLIGSGTMKEIVNLRIEDDEKVGVLYEFPETWKGKGLSEITIEFMTEPDGKGTRKYGAADNFVFQDKVLEE